MNNLKVTLIQPDLAWEDKDKNLGKFEYLFQSLKQKQDLIVLPEMFSTGFVMEPRSIAEPPDGATIQWLKKHADSMGSVITGSLVIEENGNFFNRLIWMCHGLETLKYEGKRSG